MPISADERIGIIIDTQRRGGEVLDRANRELEQVGKSGAAANEKMQAMSGKVLSAGNAFTTLTFALQNASSGAQGAVMAAGALANSVASLSRNAAIAASATGIGALVAVAGVAITALHGMGKEAEASAMWLARIPKLSLGAAEAALRAQQAQLVGLQTIAATAKPTNPLTALFGKTPEMERYEEALKNVNALYAAVIDLRSRAAATQAAENAREAEAAARKAAHMKIELQSWGELTAAIDKNARIRAAADASLAQGALEGSRAIAAAAADRAGMITDATRSAVEGAEEYKKKTKEVGDAENKATADHREAIRQRLDYSIRANESLAKTALRLALEPLITELEGIAVSEGAKALKDAAAFNLPGAALHTAAAAAAVLAARKVASLGGLGGVAGAGGAAGGAAGATSPVFQPASQGAGSGNVVINLITRDPYGREQIAQTIYELRRAGIINRPIPTTSGLALANR